VERSVDSVTRQVTDELLSLLRSGRYRVGDRLPSELELGQRLGVGRSAVREALRGLVVLDLVEVRKGRGSFVRSLRPEVLASPADPAGARREGLLRELFEARRIIEPPAAELAAARATRHEIDRLRGDVERLADALHAGYRPPEDLGFHLDILRATHNATLARLAGAIVAFYDGDARLPTERDVREHQAICDAIGDRDGQAARAAMSAHLTTFEPRPG
jgi:GntR family transcriptional repressor for pyruvate dehydrogenase complex